MTLVAYSRIPCHLVSTVGMLYFGLYAIYHKLPHVWGGFV